MYSMYGTPPMVPMRLPMSLPKIRKYSVIVIADGSSVCGQMRRMRATSRARMV